MSRRRGRKPDDSAEVDMTPMLDIVFIMLIFFIVTATFLNETGLKVDQPPPNPDPPENTDPTPVITVILDSSDQCSVDGQPTECTRVALQVESLTADKPGASIILRVSAKASHGNMVFLKDGFDHKKKQMRLEIYPEG